MPLMNSATGFRAHRMLEVVVKGITLLFYRVMPLMTITTKSCGYDSIFTAMNILSRNRSDIYRLLDKAVEQQST
ncbi:MAG: hypothetical protein HZC18_07285, partial [Candidatus Omnitrophica bacterium]|nr:hypothetical protein [Candidatus Omnitrophota bacterium]